MKKISLLLVSIALFGFIALNSCKSQAKPAEETTEEPAMEEAPAEEEPAAAADSSAEMESEAPAETPAE